MVDVAGWKWEGTQMRFRGGSEVEQKGNPETARAKGGRRSQVEPPEGNTRNVMSFR